MNKASLHVDQGEVVGLIGDNGAGKSTLIKTLVGVYGPDEGEIVIRGKKVFNWTALKARESGIETVFQDRALCPQQSIVWNIFMGKELRYPFGFVREKEQVKEANRLPYGLAAFAFTNSSKTAEKISSSIESGIVSVNQPWMPVVEVPFGGIKDSGYGKELGSEGVEAYMQSKFITQKSSI